MSAPYFSVITVAYQAGNTIGRTGASLAGYPAELLEWVVIDGGSKDATLSVLQQLPKPPDVLVSEPDKGLYDAMNKGVKLAKGEFLLFLNADDWLVPGVLLEVQAAIEQAPGFAVYAAGLIEEYADRTPHTAFPHGRWPTSMPAFQPAAFVRKSSVQRQAWFDLRFRIAADFLFFKQLQRNQLPFFHLPLVTTHFSTDGLSSNDQARMRELRQILPSLGYSRLEVAFWLGRMWLANWIRDFDRGGR